MIVCLCRAVSDRTIALKIAEGARTPAELAARCGAGTGVARAFRVSNGYARARAAPTSVQHATLRRPPTPQRETMKGDPKIIDLLNQVLTAELTAINQYFIHARMCQNWGYERLWKKFARSRSAR